MNRGTVYLVGAGPGDPRLLTVGGKDALTIADVVVYDRLVHPAQLTLVPVDAELIYVGKQADRHTLTQDKINEVLSSKALEGKTVVRLKGGDPFVFGRGGEEAEHLRNLNVPFVVVPGVTSAIAAPAYAGIPVTHRDASSSFAVITGHERSDKTQSGGRIAGEAEERRRWDKIAHAADTLIFLMGIENLGEITDRLIENGRVPETPVALIRWGTWAGRQETLVGELSSIANTARLRGFKAPAVTVVGDVVKWRDTLRWWDNRPLSGKRIVVTRAREQASSLIELLSREGAEPIEFPTIQIVPPQDDYAELDRALSSLDSFDWVVLTSVNAVVTLFKRLNNAGRDARALASVKIAAVGPATSESLASLGIIPDFVPSKFVGEEIAAEFPVDPKGLGILIVRAKDGNDRLPNGLRQMGAEVRLATAYDTVLDKSLASEVKAQISSGDVDIVTFTSSSTVTNFFSALGNSASELKNVLIACIGPSTAKTAEVLFQRPPDVVADDHTIHGLVEELKAYITSLPG
jgi:uroporphyrinogen III methyltransferase/synthase